MKRVTHMFVPTIPYDPETGISEMPDKNGQYIFSVDMAASDDETSCTCIRYGMKRTAGDKTIPLPMGSIS